MGIDNYESVRQYYNGASELEWSRLEGTPFEFALTTWMMDKYIRPGDSILDIGGGPGRYSIHYAEKGCAVTLADLSEGNVALAQKKAAEAGVRIQAHAVNCLELDALGLGQFDHVFLMGPMYHLHAEEDRVAAVEAALRRLKPGGKLYVSFIQSFAGVIFCLQHDRHLPACMDCPEDRRWLDSIAACEDFCGSGFCEYVYAYDLQNIAPFMARFPLERLHLFGQEGFLAPNKYELVKREAETAQWLELVKKYLERPDLLSWSEHIMYIGVKQAAPQQEAAL